jgi:glyoxylase-like metal-dependent hydrolase (beta-lactamase superfamily II)
MSLAGRCGILLAAAWAALAAGVVMAAVPEPVRVADGVYAFIGDPGEVDATNGGRVGNTGFIVGPTGVTVVDTGVSIERGREILAAIARVTDRPVRLAVVTHALQEFLFGNAAFEELGIPLVAHRDTVRLMRERCGTCLEKLRTVLGEDAMRGTRLVYPGREIDVTTTIDVGGRRIDLVYLGWGATPGDLVVVDRATGTAFAGGLVAVERVPSLHDARFAGWIDALDRLAESRPRTVVPAYGPPAGPAAIAEVRGYLTALDGVVRRAYDEGLSLLDATTSLDLPAYRTWGTYATTHPRNVHYRYLDLEQSELKR